VGTAYARANGEWEMAVTVAPNGRRFVLRPPGLGEEPDALPLQSGSIPLQSGAIPAGAVSVHGDITAIRDDVLVREAVRKAMVEVDARIREARPKHARYYWGLRNGVQAYNFDWDEIRHDSVVVITASEGKPPITNVSPERWVGAAPVHVLNIAPYDGGVVFAVWIDWGEPIGLWTDITVFSPKDPLWYRLPGRMWDPLG